MSVIISCPSCGQKNRVLEDAFEKQPICGRCKSPLPMAAGGGPLHLSEANLETFLTRAPKPVLVDFWAAWCGPCKMIAPVLEEFIRIHPSIILAKVDIDANPMVSAKYKIFSVPTMILFEKGVEKKRLTGAMGLRDIENQLAPWIKIN